MLLQVETLNPYTARDSGRRGRQEIEGHGSRDGRLLDAGGGHLAGAGRGVNWRPGRPASGQATTPRSVFLRARALYMPPYKKFLLFSESPQRRIPAALNPVIAESPQRRIP